jgi:hypothetical protein
MYIEAVPNRDSPPAILLRESYREAGKVKKRTLLNLSDWPHERIAGFKALLKGGTVIPKEQDAVTIIRSLPHGHLDTALGTARRIGLDRLLGPDGNRCRDLILALVISRILDPGSKLAVARALSPDTASSSLGERLGLGMVDEDELYSALDWLAVRQPAIRAEEVEGCNLFLLSKLLSSTPDVLDAENETLKQRVWNFYVGLLLASTFAPAHRPVILTGSRRGGEIDIRQQQDLDSPFPCQFRPYPPVAPGDIRLAAQLGENLEALAATPLPGGHWRLFRTLHVYTGARTTTEILDRLHQYCRALPAAPC